jgi:hypothetical protein
MQSQELNSEILRFSPLLPLAPSAVDDTWIPAFAGITERCVIRTLQILFARFATHEMR